MNADIKKITVYKTIEKDPGQIDFDFIDQILFTSGSTVRAFVKHFKEVPSHIKVYGLGQPTLNIAKEHGIAGEIVPSSDSN
jgi:uroporphyrinogen-III synthase